MVTMMLHNMRSVVRAKNKIIWIVVGWVSINVVHRFFGVKKSPKHFFQDNSVFRNVSLFLGKRVLRMTQIPIKSTLYPPPFPTGMMLSFLKSHTASDGAGYTLSPSFPVAPRRSCKEFSASNALFHVSKCITNHLEVLANGQKVDPATLNLK